MGLREVNRKNKNENQEHLKPLERHQIVKASWPGIVERNLFDEVQKSLDQNQTLARARIENAKSRVFLVSGFVFCGECNRPLVGTTGHGRSDEYRYYVHRPIPSEKVTCEVKTVRADKLEEAILNQLDHVLFREGYLDGIERRIDEIVKPQLQNKSIDLDRRKSQLAQIQKQIQAAFRLHADMGGDVVDDLFRGELLRLKTEKASVEGAIRELEATMNDELPTGDAGRKNIEINLAEYRKAKSGANQLLLKRLMRKIVESIVLEPERIALRYWTSNELRDESLTKKSKRPSDSPFGASVIPMLSSEFPSLTPSSDGSRDKEVFGLQFIQNGRGGPTVVEPVTVVREYPVMWARSKINLSELARLRWVEKWSIRELQARFGFGRTKLKEELRLLRQTNPLTAS